MNGIGSGGPSDTKIGNLDLTFRGDNDILWLDIPMDNALIVGCLNTAAYLNGDADRLFKIELSLFLDIGL